MYIVNPSQINYSFMVQRPQQLLNSFSKIGYDSIFVSKNINFPGATNYSEKTQISEHMWIVPEGHDLSQYKPAIMYVNYPPNIIFRDMVKPELMIFDSVDEPTGVFEFWNPNGEYYQALEEADLVLASAKKLYNRATEYNDNVLFVPNACEFEHFNTQSPVPDYYKTLDKPIILYLGAVATWLDTNLIWETVQKYPEYDFVFIGAPMNSSLPEAASNMHVLGHLPYSELPGYVQHADVLTIPFKEDDPVVGSTHPVKLYEYFASGNPVVTTAMPECNIEGVYWSQGYYEYIENIEEALNNKNNQRLREHRISEASKNTWSARADQINTKIEELL